MKIYFYMSLEEFTNTYLVVNEESKQALIIDPGKITEEIILQIENGGYELCAVLISHNHENHVHGLHTLTKIYTPVVYAADAEVAGEKTYVLNGDGTIKVAGLDIDYFAVPGHSADSMVYRIGRVLFTGDTITAGLTGETNSQYARRVLLNNLSAKILSQADDTVIMPGHGPPTTVQAEKEFNRDLNGKLSELD